MLQKFFLETTHIQRNLNIIRVFAKKPKNMISQNPS